MVLSSLVVSSFCVVLVLNFFLRPEIVPSWRATARRPRKELLRSPRSMGGLTRGRVRPASGVEGSRQRDRPAPTAKPGLRVLNICNSTAGEFGS